MRGPFLFSLALCFTPACSFYGPMLSRSTLRPYPCPLLAVPDIELKSGIRSNIERLKSFKAEDLDAMLHDMKSMNPVQLASFKVRLQYK